MSRLKISEKEERDRIVRAIIRGNQERYGLNDEFIAKCIGGHVITFRNKVNNEPEKIRLDELQAMAKTLKFTPIQAASIVLGRDLTAKEVKNFILM